MDLQSNCWEVGESVEAYWAPEKGYYPASVIATTTGGLYTVEFEDGIRANIRGDKIRSLLSCSIPGQPPAPVTENRDNPEGPSNSVKKHAEKRNAALDKVATVDGARAKRFRSVSRKNTPSIISKNTTKNYTVNEAIEQLQCNEDGNWIGATIFTAPPDAHEGSDADSGDELSNLSANQLRADCELVLQQTDLDTTLVDATALAEEQIATEDAGSASKDKEKVAKGKKGKPPLKWTMSETHSSDNLKNKVTGFQPPNNPQLANINGKDPVILFELFVDDKLVDTICEFTNRYALEKSEVDWKILTREEFRCFIAIIMLSGYNKLPVTVTIGRRRKMCIMSLYPKP